MRWQFLTACNSADFVGLNMVFSSSLLTLLCYVIHKRYLLLQVNVVGVPVAD
jgi:hypothetical protein